MHEYVQTLSSYQRIYRRTTDDGDGDGDRDTLSVTHSLAVLCLFLHKIWEMRIQEAVIWHMIGPLCARKGHSYCLVLVTSHAHNTMAHYIHSRPHILVCHSNYSTVDDALGQNTQTHIFIYSSHWYCLFVSSFIHLCIALHFSSSRYLYHLLL